jgi:hypothetical protein
MNTSPIITHALIESRQRDLLAQAKQARLAREAREARKTSDARLAAKVGTAGGRSAKAPARRFRLALRFPGFRPANS